MELGALLGQSFRTNLIGLEVEVDQASGEDHGEIGIVIGCFLAPTEIGLLKDMLAAQLLVSLRDSGKLIYAQSDKVKLTSLSLHILHRRFLTASVVSGDDE